MLEVLQIAVVAGLAGLVGTGAESFDLAEALGAVEPRSIGADVAFLASAPLEGRAATSAGAGRAAEYLRARARALGLAPGVTGARAAGDGFLHRFPIVREQLDVAASRLVVHSGERRTLLQPGRDYVFPHLPDPGRTRIEGPLARDEARAGAWLLRVDEGSLLRAQRSAREAGACGLVLVRTEESDRPPFEQQYEPAWRRTRDGRIFPGDAESVARGPALPTVCLTRRGARTLESALARSGDVRLVEERVALRETIAGTNVVALWPGADPNRRHECIVLCAHYDHVGVQAGRLYPGADDNASGCAGLAALAEALTRTGPLRRSIVFLWTSAEERGLWGAEAWARDPSLPDGLVPVAALNLDMIGRTEPGYLELTPTREHAAANGFSDLCYAAAAAEGFDELVSQDAYWSRSDHYALHAGLDVPVAYLCSGDHPDYHEPTDVAHKIDVHKTARIVRVVLRVLAAADALERDALGPVVDER